MFMIETHVQHTDNIYGIIGMTAVKHICTFFVLSWLFKHSKKKKKKFILEYVTQQQHNRSFVQVQISLSRFDKTL